MCVSKWQGEPRVLTVVGENHGASKLGLQCHVYTPMSTSDQVGQWVFQSGRVSQGYSQLLVRIMVQVSWARNVMCIHQYQRLTK